MKKMGEGNFEKVPVLHLGKAKKIPRVLDFFAALVHFPFCVAYDEDEDHIAHTLHDKQKSNRRCARPEQYLVAAASNKPGYRVHHDTDPCRDESALSA